jgi:hypothetical protein
MLPYTLPTAYQNFIAKSRYARWLDNKNRRETWDETINRYLDFFFVTNKSTATHLQKKLDSKQLNALRDELYEAMGTLQSLPSMRCLMTAGPALERDHIASYNCSNVNVDDIKVFSETLYVLLCGTGVGFSVERQFINKLPEVPDELFPTNTTVVVEDSKLGWAKSYHELITLLYQGQIPKWDLSKVRPAGARLKTFGGRASGPEPLERLFKFTVNIFRNAAGRRLESIECHDILCMTGEVVVVGGIRRSALLSLSNLSDLRMRDAKSGNWWETYPHRKLANNSVAYTERPEIGHFMDEWLALFRSHSGERGIINREALRYGAKKYGKRDASQIVGCNPCCFTGETKVLTATRGSVTIKSLADVSEGIVQFDVMCAHYDESNHVWVSQMKKAVAKQTGEKDVFLVTTSRGTTFKSTDDHPLAQSDGTYVQVKGAIGLDLITLFPQAEDKQIKIVSVEYVGVEPIYDLTVEDNHNFYIVPENAETHEAILVHNSEIALRSMQFCNLSTIVLRPEDTKEDIVRKVRLAAIFGTMQATLTNFKFLRKKWKQNTEEEALLGVSMTGILDHPLLGKIHSKERDEFLNEMRLEVERINKEYSEIFEINPATATTCVKPEGTVSELVDSSSGIHPRFSQYYIRAVRGDNKDPLTQFLKTTGVRWEPEIGKENSTTVFYFPKKAPGTSVTRDEITAIEQLELWKNFQEHYCEHKPSITVYVRENEWLDVAAWVWKNFDMVSGVSFLPYDNGIYQQAPYTACSEEEYLGALSRMPDIAWEKLEDFEHDDAAVTATREYACTAGACELR